MKTKSGTLMSRLISDLFEVSELAHHGPEQLILSVMMAGGLICDALHDQSAPHTDYLLRGSADHLLCGTTAAEDARCISAQPRTDRRGQRQH